MPACHPAQGCIRSAVGAAVQYYGLVQHGAEWERREREGRRALRRWMLSGTFVNSVTKE